jgi:hypothetical protein
VQCSQEARDETDIIENLDTDTNEIVWSREQEEVKSVIEEFLFVAGNYDLSSMLKMFIENASIGVARYRSGKWSTETLTIEDYVEKVKNKKLKPYIEPVKEFTIIIDDGHLAYVRADATLHSFGKPWLHNIDYFTLLRENERWIIVSAAYTSKELSENEMILDVEIFGRSYAQAWCSRKPEYVAMYYDSEGSLTVNNGEPAKGHEEIREVASSFMTAFPDMIVAMDSLVKTAEGIEFHWTLTGTNTGPGGTGNKVKISGFELWRLNDRGFIKESTGTFDSDEYDRQIKYGIDN